jgi:signal transduction histidine kinase
MRERMASIGGTFGVQTAADAGTILEASVPGESLKRLAKVAEKKE